MNSYYDDEPPHISQGRARVPGNGGYGPDDGYESERPYDADAYLPEDPYDDMYAPPLSDRASVGRASVGRAAVRPASGYDDGYPSPHGYAAPSYGASGYGAPGYGGGYDQGAYRPDPRDPYGVDEGFDPFASEGFGPPPGRAPIGRASVGRATVPGSPGGSFGPGGPAGPGGPSGRGPAGPGGKPLNKKARQRNRILAMFASIIMLTGLLVVGATYYSASIPLPKDQPLAQSTTITYSDGKTIMARIGEQTRTLVTLNQVPIWVQHAVIATEDETFYSNIGVDFKGMARAFVNNITGGQTQGASTITQQYARYIAGLSYAPSYTRKAREVVIAIKLAQNYTKAQILEDYLNTVLFGRQAYGIQAAAQAYFGKDVGQLSVGEGMVLAGLIKDPNGGIYDPSQNLATATTRWDYTKQQMVKLGFLSATDAAALTYPKTYLPPKGDLGAFGMDTPAGFIVHHVMDELTKATDAHGRPLFPASGNNDLKNGGYTIVTTIDKQDQSIAEEAAGGLKKGTPMYGIKTGIGAALVSVQPGTGRVLAYYGGQNGANLDFGGIYNDPVTTQPGMTGQHIIPGSSFKTITLAAALKEDISINSYWYGPPMRSFPDRIQPVRNADSSCPGEAHICTLWRGLKGSMNTIFYAVGEQIGPAKVIDMAHDLGIDHLWSDQTCSGKRFDLTAGSGAQLYHKCFGAEVSFGQYGVTVQDMANVMSTIAAHGVRYNEHFVSKVYAPGQKAPVYRESIVPTPVPGLNSAKMDDETWAMEQVMTNGNEQDNQLLGGRQAAVKTGTWQLDDTVLGQTENSNAMFNGFTAGNWQQGQIAASVWVGDTGKSMALKDQNDRDIGGATIPADIWKYYIDRVLASAPMERFNPPAFTGSTTAGETPSPEPSFSFPSGPPTFGCPGFGCPSTPPDTSTPTGPTGTPTGTPSGTASTGGHG